MSTPLPDATHAATFETTAGVAMTGDLPLAEVLSRLSESNTRKGFFFRKHLRTLGDGYAELRPQLETPPALGTYLPFVDYSSRDYFRILDAAARLRFPGLSMAEAHRRLGREELGSFLEQVVARVAWSSFDDPMAVFGAWAELSKRVMSKPHGEATKIGERHARLEYDEPVASIPYGIGVFEGIVLAFKQHPRITVTHHGSLVRYDIRWAL